MMDQTKLFVATVKAVRLQMKSMGRDLTSLVGGKCKPSSEFTKEANKVYSGIKKLKDFLLMSRKDYIASTGFLLSESRFAMSDDDRNKIDCEVQEFIQTYADHIQGVRRLIGSCTNQVHLHRKLICDLLGEHLKSACELYSEQRAIRVKKIVEKKRSCRLQTNLNNSPRNIAEDSGNERAISVSEYPTFNGATSSSDLTAEEESTFAAENQQLFTQMSSMTSELKQIEGKVIEISRLQEVFAEKVLSQAEQLDTIADLTVESSENIQGGNSEIQQAIRNKATLRIWILFILIVCSVALLFLDWYS